MPIGDKTSADDEVIATDIIDAAFKVHSQLGPGLLESAYEHCLVFELRRRGHHVDQQLVCPLIYDGHTLDVGYRIDLRVDHRIIVDVKAVEQMHKVFPAQVLTYVKLQCLDLRLLINFNVPLIKDGIKRIVRFD